MKDGRKPLPVGVTVEFDNGDVYKIVNDPIGCGGGSILYPAQKQFVQNGILQTDGIVYVLKECYPISLSHSYTRKESGEVVPVNENKEDMRYLQRAQLLQLEEGQISQKIYRTSSRTLPIRSSSQSVFLDISGYPKTAVPNTFTVMDSLSEKGRSLSAWIKERRRFSLIESFRIIQQLLFALREVHQSGYLHLDIQDGNVFLRGTLEDKDELVTLIDFGCARELVDGKTNPIRDRVIFSTQGFSAPEILLHNDGNLQLGPEADIYSVGCLLMYLLTGQRANIRELIASRTGIYLRSNQLRRIKCPNHLIDTLQRIMAQALAKDPEKRYHSADDMLKDVEDFIIALQPYRTNLSAVKYDAFVCYKHGSIDSAAALTLQRALENYHAPKGVAEKRKPFGRIFVDEGELSSCADFGQQIREALRNSGWLIVICSPDTPQSPWVQQEIDIFLEEHNNDRSKILAVLVGGNPESSFPPQLRGDASGAGEVFAAHALSDTPQAAAKLLKRDALLKIAAPMLGTTYDTLKQRHKIFRLQKITAATACLLMAAIGFGSYAMDRANVIEKQAIRIEEEYEKALINESLFLTEQAQKRLDNNDPLSAMELVLQALPSEKQVRPVLTEAEFILSESLGVYSTPDSNRYTVTAVGKINTDRDRFYLNETGSHLFVWDSMGGGIQVWETITMTLLHEFYPDNEFGIELYGTCGSKMIFGLVDTVLCVDYLTGQEIWVLEDSNIKCARISEGKQTVLLFSRNQGYSLDSARKPDTLYFDEVSIDDGEILYSVEFYIPEHLYVQDIYIAEEETRAAVVTQENNPYSSEPRYSAYILNLETGDYQLLFESDAGVEALQFYGDQLAVIRNIGWIITAIEEKTVNSSVLESTSYLEAYNLQTQECCFSYDYVHFPKSNGICAIRSTTYDDGMDTGSGFLFTIDDQCVLLDQNTGTLIRKYNLPSSVMRICCKENGFETINVDGSVCVGNYKADLGDKDSLWVRHYWTNAVTMVYENSDFYYVQHAPFGVSMDFTIRKYQKDKHDDAYQPFWHSEEYGWKVLGCCELDDKKCVILAQDNQIGLAETDGRFTTYAIPAEYGFSVYSDAVLSGETLSWGHYEIDLCTGAIYEKTEEVPMQAPWSEDLTIVSSDSAWNIYCSEGEILLQDKEGRTLRTIPVDTNLAGIQFTPNEESLLLYTTDNKILRYGIDDGWFQGSVDLKNINTLSLLPTTRGELLWEYLDEETLLVITAHESFLLDISKDNIIAKATIDHCVGFDRKSNSFIVADMTFLPLELALIPRYSLEELIQMGNATLGK